MAQEIIGHAEKNPDEIHNDNKRGVSFEMPYGHDRYGITLSNHELDMILDNGYAESMGRLGMIGANMQVNLERPDLPVFVHPLAFTIEKERSYTPTIEMHVGIVTMSYVHEHRGVLLVSRYGSAGKWAYGRYDIEPPLKDPRDRTAVRRAA